VSSAGGGARDLVAESEALGAVKRFAEAADRARDAVLEAPGDPAAFCAWSRALYGQHRFAEAAEKAQDAIRVAPEYAVAFRLHSMALSSLARTLPKGDQGRLGADAATSARDAVRLAPWDPNGQMALAQALSLTGATRDADAAVQEALRLAPDSAATWVAASVVAIGAKNWTAAISASRRALAIDPGNSAALNNLGVALRASGNKGEGTRALADAARANPDNPVVRTNISRAGVNVVRIAVLIVLVPIGLLTHLGFGLYAVAAILINVLIMRRPAVLLRLERWTAPIALAFARKPDDESVAGPPDRPVATATVPATAADEQPWSATEGRSRFGGRVMPVTAGAVVAWSIAVLLVMNLEVPGPDKVGFAVASALTAAVAAVLTVVAVVRRKRRRA